MALEILHQIRCDEKGCGRIGVLTDKGSEHARQLARGAGWDVGPHYSETRSGRLTHHTDYCPEHKRGR